ncbi:MAG: helix-turn-helix domain-containing protein, partial [Anaerolineae bacterium]|uniref:MerR family transcriptional regulator n=1 Tax=Thermoflexus sp. TaxID=1969742 RepID=UPI0025ECC249
MKDLHGYQIRSENVLLKPKEAARLLGVTARCLRKWAQSGKVVTVRTPGGHYRYPLESILSALPIYTRGLFDISRFRN